MGYQVTCVCGNRFSVDSSQVGKHVACPACNRALIPLATAAEGAPGTPGGTGAAEPTKRCPYCGEVILAVARKCRFCNEYLDRAPADHPGGTAAGAPGAAGGTKPEAVFTLSVSQWDNFWRYLICLLVVVAAGLVLWVKIPMWHDLVAGVALPVFLIVLLLTGLVATLFYLGTRNSRCTIWPTRIETETGVFSKKVDSVELYRVKDVELKQNLLERMIGIGTIMVVSTDAAQPQLELYQIPMARKVHKYLLEQLPKVDAARGVLRVEQ